MSTKAIEKVLRDMQCDYTPCQPTSCRKHEAMAELEAIRKAAAFIVSESQDVDGAVWAMGLLESIAEERP
jgi:hypothetical protein